MLRESLLLPGPFTLVRAWHYWLSMSSYFFVNFRVFEYLLVKLLSFPGFIFTYYLLFSLKNLHSVDQTIDKCFEGQGVFQKVKALYLFHKQILYISWLRKSHHIWSQEHCRKCINMTLTYTPFSMLCPTGFAHGSLVDSCSTNITVKDSFGWTEHLLADLRVGYGQLIIAYKRAATIMEMFVIFYGQRVLPQIKVAFSTKCLLTWSKNGS